jgi:hypothetical protein
MYMMNKLLLKFSFFLIVVVARSSDCVAALCSSYHAMSTARSTAPPLAPNGRCGSRALRRGFLVAGNELFWLFVLPDVSVTTVVVSPDHLITLDRRE